MSRPKSENTERVSFKIDPELFERLQFFAWENHVSMADVFRDAFSFYAEAFVPTPEEQEQQEALLAQTRAERQRQDMITALPELVITPVALPN